ncbi:hypothetical protein ACW73L_05455 [Methylolobus aquaticus]
MRYFAIPDALQVPSETPWVAFLEGFDPALIATLEQHLDLVHG